MPCLRELLALGRELGMEPLVEVHTREELTRALAVGARIIGVNNRDLRTLEVRVETSHGIDRRKFPRNASPCANPDCARMRICVRFRAAGFDAFLIGEHLMAQPDPGAALRKLLGRLK